MITDDEQRMLQFIYTTKHPTTEQIHRHLFAHVTKRWVEKQLAGLRDLGLIQGRLLYPEQGARSPRYYSLRLAGARAIGVERLGSHHYRVEQREFFHARSARLELEYLASRHQWRLHTDTLACREALRGVFVDAARQQYGERFPPHTITPLLPGKFSPDRVLQTATEVIIVIIAHPHSGRAFWTERMERYKQALRLVRAIAIPLTDEQHREAQRVIAEAGVDKRFLVLTPATLMEIERRLS